MVETSRNLDMEELLNYGNNLIEFLKEEKDAVGLKRFLRHAEASQSQWAKHFNQVQKSIEEYEKKIDACEQKAAAAVVCETALDAELDALQKELDEEQQSEEKLRKDLRVIINKIDDLERQRVSLEEEMQAIKKVEQDELRAQMKLSMYASVTNIIPYLDDQSKISGHIVDRDKKVVDKFDLDPLKDTFDSCNDIWKMINL